MEKTELIELLNKDLEDEHGAIIQYLGHAYAIGEGELSCEIEAIAREEMRHLDLLAEHIVALGGRPSLERGHMNMGGATVPEWMANDTGLEAGAIAQYTEHLRLIDDADTRLVLERILSDEKSHHDDFQHFVDKTKREGTTDQRGDQTDRTLQTVNWGIEHEYTVTLQYLLQSYVIRDEESREQLQDQAINEMQHMGWLAEKMVSRKGTPSFEHIGVNRTEQPAEMLTADIAIEKEVAAAYDHAARETDDMPLKKLFQRLRDHELYHAQVFGDLLKKTEK